MTSSPQIPLQRNHAADNRNSPAVDFYLCRPLQTLTVLFIAWKTILFLIVANCPGFGYDTSTALLAASASVLPSSHPASSSLLPSIPFLSFSSFSSAPWKFVRWDAIYFVRVAERGYLYEQEWAWGYGYTQTLGYLASIFAVPSIATIATCGIALSHICHFLSVVALHYLTNLIFASQTRAHRGFCLVTAALHIISPAGAFLSAPYTEPLFSLLNFAGFYCYTSALLAESTGHRGRRDVFFLLAGALFAIATTIRGNGILSGCMFVYDAVLGALRLLEGQCSIDLIRRTGVVGLGGMILGLGFIVPQYIAYTEYCDTAPRPWCGRFLPSIYTWVQAHYWNNGFFKYWTVSNIPLFILAAPVLALMMHSSWVALLAKRLGPPQTTPVATLFISASQAAITRLAVTQGVLAVMALTSFHVQIINRISTGYPVWYWGLASWGSGALSDSSKEKQKRFFPVAVQAMAMYALVQAVLFGSFLPPA